MIIQLEKELKVVDLEDEFSIFYPFIKIHLEPVNIKRKQHKDNKIEITGSETVEELQRSFIDHLAMNVTVYRKQHDEWIEIPTGNKLSLKQQNELGRAEAEHEKETKFQDFFETDF